MPKYKIRVTSEFELCEEFESSTYEPWVLATIDMAEKMARHLIERQLVQEYLDNQELHVEILEEMNG